MFSNALKRDTSPLFFLFTCFQDTDPGRTLSYACNKTNPSFKSSKSDTTGGSTSNEFNHKVNTLASLSPSASNSSISIFSCSSIGCKPGWVLNKWATKAKFNFGLPETNEFGVKYFLHPILSALVKTCSALVNKSLVFNGDKSQYSGCNWCNNTV